MFKAAAIGPHQRPSQRDSAAFVDWMHGCEFLIPDCCGPGPEPAPLACVPERNRPVSM